MASKIVVNLDTSKEFYESYKCKQNDDLTLIANIFENGAAKDLANCSIVIQARKADKTYIIQNTEIAKSDNKLTVELVRDFTRVSGGTNIEIVLAESSKQNTTFSFCLEVVESVIKGAEESKDLITSLEVMQDAVVEMGRISEETKDLINNSGAASKEEINKVNASLAEKAQQTNNKNVKFIACAIRNTGNGFEFINDTMHNPLNGATLVTESNRITLNYGFTAGKVLSLLATTDETLAQLGFNVGTSVGLDNAKIYLSKQDKVFGYLTKSGGSAVIFAKTDNISNGIADLIWESGAKRLKITHDKCYNPIPNIFTRNPEIIAYPIAINPRGGFTTTYIGFRENKSLSSIIRYVNDGFTNSGDNGGITGLSWDSVNSRLTVNHKSINNLCVNLTNRVLGLEIIPYVVGEDYVTLEFYKNGTKITTPTSDINFILNKQSDNSVNIIPADGTVICVSYEGLWDISPSEVTYSNSNIWLFGIMEI